MSDLLTIGINTSLYVLKMLFNITNLQNFVGCIDTHAKHIQMKKEK